MKRHKRKAHKTKNTDRAKTQNLAEKGCTTKAAQSKLCMQDMSQPVLINMGISASSRIIRKYFITYLTFLLSKMNFKTPSKQSYIFVASVLNTMQVHHHK